MTVTTTATATNPGYGARHAADRHRHGDSDATLHTKDIVGAIMAAIMTLGPLAATAWIGI
jgi:hypothetical protein